MPNEKFAYQTVVSYKLAVLEHARLSVAQIDAEKADMLSDNFWPEHISIRPWIFTEDGEIVERFESGGRRLRASN